MGIGEVTILGMIGFHQITLEKELHLVDLAVFVSEVVLFGIIFANVDQFANADFGADFFKDFTLERLVQGLSEFLTTARQNGVSASAILLAQNEQLAILDDDSFDGIPQFLFLRHFVRILPHNLPTVIQRYRARCSHKGKAMFPKKNADEFESKHEDVLHVVDHTGFDAVTDFRHAVIGWEEQMLGDAFKVFTPKRAVVGNGKLGKQAVVKIQLGFIHIVAGDIHGGCQVALLEVGAQCQRGQMESRRTIARSCSLL